jgi:hypothetical protein
MAGHNAYEVAQGVGKWPPGGPSLGGCASEPNMGRYIDRHRVKRIGIVIGFLAIAFLFMVLVFGRG